MPKSIYYAGHRADQSLLEQYKRVKGVLTRLPENGPDEHTRDLIAYRLHAMSLRMSVDQFLGLKARPATELETARYNAAAARQARLNARAQIAETREEMRDTSSYLRGLHKKIKKVNREIESLERFMVDSKSKIETMTAKVKELDDTVDAMECKLRQAEHAAKAEASK